MDPIEPTDPLRHGCMQSKAPQPYVIETLPNRNTLWRCAVCRHVVNLIPGIYSAPEGLGSGEVSP
jgi:hypothetical protein